MENTSSTESINKFETTDESSATTWNIVARVLYVMALVATTPFALMFFLMLLFGAASFQNARVVNPLLTLLEIMIFFGAAALVPTMLYYARYYKNANKPIRSAVLSGLIVLAAVILVGLYVLLEIL